MTTRKYITEGCLNMRCTNPLLVQHHKLDGQDSLAQLADYPPHIYMICRRPRITFDPKSVEYGDGTMGGVFLVHEPSARVEIPFTAKCSWKPPLRNLVCDYPYNRISFTDEKGELITSAHAAHWMMFVIAEDGLHDHTQGRYLDLEVLYVGQAYGTDGTRTAPDRLKSHETLLGIYSKLSAEAPDDEIWLAMLCFDESWLIMSIDGRDKGIPTSRADDDRHTATMLGDTITERQKVCFTEAALIRYFQPPYNSTFKKQFPSPSHGSYSQCYDIDLNSIAVELSFENFPLKLFSQSVAARYTHLISYPLHSAELRKSMFEVMI